jgi:HSP20 family molecular chaperone IbpA
MNDKHDTTPAAAVTTSPASESPASGPAIPSTDARPELVPAVDIYENRDEYLVLADLPGVRQGGLHLRYHKGELAIEGVRELTRGRSDAGASEERLEAVYRRAFRVPDVVDADGIRARFEHGVLELHLPKSDAIKPRTIEVRSA